MVREYLRMALRSLISHKARSLLTMLGVIIGVAAVILLISLGDSAKAEAAAQIQGLGSNLVMVSVSDPNGYLPAVWIDELAEKAQIASYSRIIQGSASFSVEGQSYNVSVNGVNEYYNKISTMALDAGRFFTGVDVDNSLAVAVIGPKVAEKLYGQSNPLGQTIVIRGIPFEVIGLVEERGTSFNGDLDEMIYIPYGYAATLYPSAQFKIYYIESQSELTAENTRSRVESYLSRTLPSDKMYSVFSQAQILSMLDQIMGLLTSLLAGIAAISLLVGGIGIMNIMLVTVRERTREIGIRKALGARKNTILVQFLIEAVVITVIGGLIGLGISWLGTLLISVVAGFSVMLGASSVVLALLFSTIVGVAFGIYPANKASSLAPVEALRFE